jgi:hypothetical protein
MVRYVFKKGSQLKQMPMQPTGGRDRPHARNRHEQPNGRVDPGGGKDLPIEVFDPLKHRGASLCGRTDDRRIIGDASSSPATI